MTEKKLCSSVLSNGLHKYCDLTNYAILSFLCHHVGDIFSVALIYYTCTHVSY